MIKVFIIEDEKHILDELLLLLSARKDVIVVGTCTSVEKAVQVLPNLEIDLAIMDIQLDDGKSFEIIERLEHINFNIIFITAFDEYAIQAIKVGAMDYLLKPINETELYDFFDKLGKQQDVLQASKQTQVVAEQYNNKDIKKIVVRTMHEIFFIEIDSIYFCKGEGNYTTFYLENDKKITSSKPLREYLSILPKNIFIKTHQSYIVNKNYVDCYKHSCEIIMQDQKAVPVSVRHKENVIKKLSDL